MNWKAVVDRIEEKMAVVLFGDDEIQAHIPVQLLPPNVKEGDHLHIAWEIDSKATQAAEERVNLLLNRLLDRSNE